MSRSRVLPFALFALAFALAPLAHAQQASYYDTDRYGYNDGRGDGYRDQYAPRYEQGNYNDRRYSDNQNLHDEVHEAVEQALGADAARIRIDVRGRNVYLSGSVRNARVRAIAHEVAHDVPGVRSVSMRNLYVSRGYAYRY